MGNYRGNVRCSYCYERGHNRRTCPERLERLQRNLEIEQNGDGRYENYYAHQIAKMTGENPVTGEKNVKRRNESGGRQCSYCKEYGHNRRTCPVLKKDLARYKQLTAETRRTVREWALQDGVGVGAMVKYKRYGYEEPKLMMVAALNLQITHARQPHYVAHLKSLDGRTRDEIVAVNNPERREEFNKSRYSSQLYLVGPLNPEQMAAQISEAWTEECPDWKSPPDGLCDSLFNKGASRDYLFWRQHDEARD